MSSSFEGEEAGLTGARDVRVRLIWSQETQAAADALPANLGRSSMVHSLIRAFDLTDDGAETPPNADRQAFITPPDLTLGTAEALRRYHDDGYVRYVLKDRRGDLASDGPSSSDSASDLDNQVSEDESDGLPARKRRKREHGLEHDCPPFPELAEYAKLIAAGTQTAARLVARGEADIAIFWDGGRHHAMRNRASGFCYVGDVVLGIMLLCKEGRPREATRSAPQSGTDETTKSSAGRSRKPRVMYVDLDLHYGDGVAQAFLSPARYPPPDQSTSKRPPRPPQVLTLSVHHSAPIFFPPPTTHSLLPAEDTPNPFTLSIPLEAYPSNATYASIWTSVERVRKAFEPDYVVLQLGADGLPGDPIGRYGNWSVDGEGGMLWCVRQVQNWGLPMVVLGGGGYDHPTTARAWTRVTARLLGRDISAEEDVPHHESFPEYAPSFTMDMEPGQNKDENTDETRQAIEERFRVISDRIANIISAHI